MPSPRKSLRDQVPHGEHLNFVNKFKAAFMPVEDRDAYLAEAARRNKEQAEIDERERAAAAKRIR